MADSGRLAVSNIAWEPEEDDTIAAVLRSEGVAGVEIAPTKWRRDPLEATVRDVIAYRRSWEDRGLRIVSLQSLLFGRPELQLFGPPPIRADLTDYLKRTIDLGAALGAHALVFGSPKNRVRGDLSEATAAAIAVELFREIGDHAWDRGVALCIEANPPAYGCDFVTTTAEAVTLCDAINNRGIGINGDLGGMTMVGEDPKATIESAGSFLRHFHASEPQLVELGTDGERGADHQRAAAGLVTIGYSGWVSIEMRSGQGEGSAGSNAERVGRAVQRAKRAYASLSRSS